LYFWFATVVNFNREEAVDEAIEKLTPKIKEEIRSEFKEEIERKRTWRNLAEKREKELKRLKKQKSNMQKWINKHKNN
jgi:hypothetical protein